MNWPSDDTDISSFALRPESPPAVQRQREQRFFEMHLMPPPKGSIVRVFGFPESVHEIEGGYHLSEASLEMYLVRVSEMDLSNAGPPAGRFSRCQIGPSVRGMDSAGASFYGTGRDIIRTRQPCHCRAILS